MSYISLYRKWRSQTFDEIKGQDHIVKTLKNAISGNRIAHAYLFSGPRGTGKTSTARVFAKALNCENGPTINPCGQCSCCAKIKNGNAVDVIEIDAASNRGIDEIRDLRERIRYTPVEGKYKLYIIDEVHMLTNEAFNALLKTLEEPPEHVIFVLATTEPQKVPLTVTSRCQRLDFRRISSAEIETQLLNICKNESVKIDGDSVAFIAKNAEGSMRDAISLLDQLFSFCGSKVTFSDLVLALGAAQPAVLFDLSGAIISRDYQKVVRMVDSIISEGRNVVQVVKDLIGMFRQMLMVNLGAGSILDVSGDQLVELSKHSQQYSVAKIKQIMDILSKAEADMRWYPDARLVFEVALLDIIGEEIEAAKTPEKALIEKVKDNWDSILKKVKSKSIFAYVSLQEGIPANMVGNKLSIKFKKGFSFHKDRLDEDQNKKAIEDTLSDILGELVCIKSEIDSSCTDKSDISGSTKASLEDILEIFEGKKIS